MSRFFEERIKEEKKQLIRERLESARMPKSPEEFFRTIVPVSISVGIVIFGISLYFLPMKPLLLSPVVGIVSAYLAYRILLLYPSMKARERREEIDDMLPSAAAFMLSMSKGGFGPVETFRALSEREEYGEMTKEAKAIIRNIEYVGYSPVKAMEKVAETTPSEDLRRFLKSLVSTYETGADPRKFFEEKCNEYFSDIEEEGERSMENLPSYGAVGLMLLGLGPLIIILVWISVALLGGGFFYLPVRMMVFIGYPLGVALYIVLVDRLFSPSIRARHLDYSPPESSISIRESIQEMRNMFRNLFSSAIQLFYEHPKRVFYLTVPFAIVFVLLGFYFGLGIETFGVFGAVVLFLPFVPFYELRKRRVEKVIRRVPDFLTSFSDSVDSGLTPTQAVESLPPERFGAFGTDLESMKRDLAWKDSLASALGRFSRRLQSDLIQRMGLVLEKASEMGERVGDVARILSSEILMYLSLMDDRRAKASAYVFMTYIVFFLAFAGLGFMIIVLKEMGGIPPLGGLSLETTPIKIEPIKTLIYRTILVQGFATGIIAGKLRNGTVWGGIKHSLIMILIGWLAFTFAPI